MRVAQVLGGAGLLDEAHAAVHLHAGEVTSTPVSVHQPLTIGISRSTPACAACAPPRRWPVRWSNIAATT
jgi:hypothetical protein